MKCRYEGVVVEVDVTTNVNVSKQYLHVVKSWEFDTFETAVKEAVKVTKVLSNDGLGICLFLVDNYDDCMLLPTHETKYFLEGIECSRWDYECNEEATCEHHVTHNVEWTKVLGIEDNSRLCLYYTGTMYNDDQVEELVSIYEKPDWGDFNL